jgi:hypothetical protein
MFLQLKNESSVQGSVTKSCVYIFQCEHKPNEYLDDAMTEWMKGCWDWIGRKCQKNGQLVIMKF